MKYTKEDEELFDWKTEFLKNNKTFKMKQVYIEEFFHLLFERNGELQLQERGKYRDNKYNAIVMTINTKNKDKNEKKRKGSPKIILNDLDGINNFLNQETIITAPITYVGKKRNAKQARLLYGFVFDIDAVGKNQIIDIIHQMKISFIPTANMIVNSGHGVHLYYLLDKPFFMYQSNQTILNEFKHKLTELLWNSCTSYDPEKQYQNILQGFRIPGTKTKFDTIVTGFKLVDRPLWSFEELWNWLYTKHESATITPEEYSMLMGEKIIEQKPNKKSKVANTLEQLKEKYPEWYEKRIVRKEPKGRWVSHRALYDWWVKKLRQKKEVKVGHRYSCIMCLVLYAKKCNVPYEELKNDALSFIDDFDAISDSETNRFTEQDVIDALKMYKEDIVTFPINSIEHISGIRINKNKRNFRKQALHLQGARALQVIYNPNWREGNGRPKGSVITADNSKHAKQIQKWRLDNPKGNKSQCARDLGISRPTIIKWWDCEMMTISK